MADKLSLIDAEIRACRSKMKFKFLYFDACFLFYFLCCNPPKIS